MWSNEPRGNLICSRKNSDSSVVNLLSTDDEIYSVISEEDEWISPETKQDETPFAYGGNQQFACKNILISRILGPPCGCRRKCREQLNKDQEVEIFSKFWNLASHDQQNFYLFSCIQVGKKKKTKGPDSRRTITAYYSVDNGYGINVNVCKNEFLNLHGLQKSKGRIDRIVKMKKEGAAAHIMDARGKNRNRPKKRRIPKQNG